jgi:hypothetical protein
MTPEFGRACIKMILAEPSRLNWTVQGFGMMRTYIPGPVYDKQYRLNVWDTELAVPGVSVIHDHPWDFESWVVSGEFANLRFVEDYFNGDRYQYMEIKTGEGGGPEGKELCMNLRSLPVEHYASGDHYQQRAAEIHLSGFNDGTVTLNERTRIGDGEHAHVFWPAGSAWVDAKPRRAHTTEIMRATERALEKWR